jgi:hypothetical protein
VGGARHLALDRVQIAVDQGRAGIGLLISLSVSLS